MYREIPCRVTTCWRLVDVLLTYSVEMASQLTDLQLAMKQTAKEEELRQAEIESDTKDDQLQVKLQELQNK